MKKFYLIIALLALLVLSGCGGASDGEPVGSCTLEIRCDTILVNMDQLTPGKEDLVPADGTILPPTQIDLYEGDSVYDILLRYFQQQKMHYEFSGSDSTAYMAGLCNLYEFDCGPLSGWEYEVNGDFPTIGLGGYDPADGDTLRMLYTCDLGRDVGDTNQ